MNDTNYTVLPPYGERYWIVSELIIVCALFVTLYLSLSLTTYLWKIRGEKDKKHLKKLLFLNLLAALFAILRLSSDQAVAFLGWKTDEHCFYFVCTSLVLYSASISPTYTALWMRQHAFYTNKKLQTDQNKRFVRISYACLALLIAGWIAVTVVYITPSSTGWKYVATPDGCRDTNDEQDFEVVTILTIIVGGSGQLVLLSLLLHPLLKRRQPTRRTKKKAIRINKEQYQSTANLTVRYYPNGSDDEVFASTSRSPMPSPAKHQVRKNISGDDSDVGQQTPEKTKLNFQSPKRKANPQRDVFTHKKTDSFSSLSSIIFFHKRKDYQMQNTHRKRSHSEIKREKQLMSLISKMFALAVVCVTTDVIATILQLVLVEPELIYLAIYDISLIINITCITFSFENWKIILAFWKKSRSQQYPRLK